MKTKWWAVAMVLAATFLTSTAQLFYKLATQLFPPNPSPLDFLSNYFLIGGLFLYFVAAGILILALRGGELSILYPLVALSYVWVSLLSMFFLGESMNLLKWSGISVIMLGMFFIGKGSSYGS